MTSPVISLAAERSKRRPAEGCPTCERRADGMRCFSHRVADLADRLRVAHVEHAGELLLTRDVLDNLLDDALEVLDGITAECLPDDQRSVK